MYRGDEPAFCRGCGAPWTPGTAACHRCGEPVTARLVNDGFDRKLPAFTRQRGLVWALTILTVVYALTVLGELVTGWMLREMLLEYIRTGFPGAGAIEVLTRHGWSMLCSTAVYFVVIVLFGCWLVRAGRNLRALGVVDTTDIDEARILWFFVPGLHLYRPLLGIRQLWQGSHAADPGRWQQERTPMLLWGWWAVWLASNVLGDAALYACYTAPMLEARLTGTELDLGWAALRLLCVPLFLAVVWGIERAQSRRG